jgi:hypothetical protein
MTRTGYTGSLSPSHEWSATEEDYEAGDPIGYGPTEQDAIDDLLNQLEDES